jgi:hypothetical protein
MTQRKTFYNYDILRGKKFKTLKEAKKKLEVLKQRSGSDKCFIHQFTKQPDSRYLEILKFVKI